MQIISVNVFGEEQLKRALGRFADKIEDYRPAFMKIRDDFFQIEYAQFRSEGARMGATWKRLSPRYKAWKDRYYPGKQILVLTGSLKNMMTRGLGLQYELYPKMLRMIPVNPVAQWHQRATYRMPRRPVIVLIEEDRRRWTKIMHEYVFDTARSMRLV